MQTESGAGHCRRHAVLPSPCFCDNSLLSHSSGEEGLSKCVVDLVCSAVEEVFSLQIDPCTSNILCEVSSEIEWRGASRVGFQQIPEFFLEGWISRVFIVRFFQILQRLHQGLRHVLAAVLAEPAAGLYRGFLDLHEFTSSLTFCSTFEDFIMQVPTRKAWAPAVFSRFMSATVSIPLSETTGPLTGLASARILSVVSRSTWKLERLRLFIP